MIEDDWRQNRILMGFWGRRTSIKHHTKEYSCNWSKCITSECSLIFGSDNRNSVDLIHLVTLQDERCCKHGGQVWVIVSVLLWIQTNSSWALGHGFFIDLLFTFIMSSGACNNPAQWHARTRMACVRMALRNASRNNNMKMASRGRSLYCPWYITSPTYTHIPSFPSVLPHTLHTCSGKHIAASQSW